MPVPVLDKSNVAVEKAKAKAKAKACSYGETPGVQGQDSRTPAHCTAAPVKSDGDNTTDQQFHELPSCLGRWFGARPDGPRTC